MTEAISLYCYQLWWIKIFINPAVGCHYFPSGPQLHTQPLSITASWLVPNYTARSLAQCCTRQHVSRDSIPRPVDRRSGFLTVRPYLFILTTNRNIVKSNVMKLFQNRYTRTSITESKYKYPEWILRILAQKIKLRMRYIITCSISQLKVITYVWKSTVACHIMPAIELVGDWI